ncbi:MAG: lysophospholipid acyltransferase family protein [Ferruginibacter sp.]
MYYIIYGFLYAISLLPFFILYRLSDFAYFLIYYVFGYRKKGVMENLEIAFPEKSYAEKKTIAKQFYKNFVDTFIETIKILSLSDKEFVKRCTGDFSAVDAVAATGKSIQFMCGHQFNWEYINLFLGRNMKIPFIGVVANIENKALNRIYNKLRGKYGTILIPNSSFKRQMVEWMKQQYSICLAADQNSAPERGAWMNFFGKRVPFIMGPHTSAARFQPVIIYFDFKKPKRGYYKFELLEIITNPEDYTSEQFLIKYRDHLENMIRKDPTNYLWTHRRWKHVYNESYSKNLVEK